MSLLPTASPAELARSQVLTDKIAQKIVESGGWINFATFMHMALYLPALGYYSGGATKFGQAGDFVTAPEISPLFAQTLAKQTAQILLETNGDVLELGAGTGKLAADLLLELATLNQLPSQYFILEVSDHLRQIQLETLQKKLQPELFEKIVWLDALPPPYPQPSPSRGEGVQGFVGLILANEVLDAIPAHILHKTTEAWRERGVGFTNEFVWQDAPLSAFDLIENLPQNLIKVLPENYVTEVCPAALGLVNSLANCLKQGVILMIDYGFGAAEYYHPQRNQGTLMCHYQHYAHDNPLINVGLQDITAHVNFTAIAEAGVAQGLTLAGYCNQASFLINCGLLDILAEVSPNDMAAYTPLAAAAQKLLSPAEMGELFKVIGFTKNMDEPLIGFTVGDKTHAL